MGLEDYGLAPGKKASLVVLEASDPIEAIRLRANRLFVIARGKVVATAPSRASTLALQGRAGLVTRRHIVPPQD
jgi:cytosine deaminase